MDARELRSRFILSRAQCEQMERQEPADDEAVRAFREKTAREFALRWAELPRTESGPDIRGLLHDEIVDFAGSDEVFRSTRFRALAARVRAAGSRRQQARNTLWSVIQHLVAVLCGLILPREILSQYGSEVNGVFHSLSQFLSYTVLLELGIGAVIPAALYQPLAGRNMPRVSAILSSGRKVYQRIALICAGYTVLLVLLFPPLSGIDFAEKLILVLGATTFAKYMAGTPEQLLIISDQKGYVIYALATAAQIVSTIVQVALIRAEYTLWIVKGAAGIITVVQIGLICLYAKKHSAIDRKIRYTEEPISQKWNGIAQHVAHFVLENTDIILLTLFTTFKEVSVYSVYFLFISGVRGLFSAVCFSMQPKLGALKAGGDEAALNRFFGKYERWVHLSVAAAFGLLGVIIVPFVQVYSSAVQDVNYTRPLFALLITAAYGVQSIRDPYDKLIVACGHFRQTQKNYIVAASLNFGISIVAVQFWGLEGVAAGTLIAMVYQLIYMSVYITRVLLKRSGMIVLRNLLMDVVVVGALILLLQWIRLPYADLFRIILP